MFIKAMDLTDGHVEEADVCIIGAGPAGITIARALRGGSRRICLLESGGFEGDAQTQSLYRGESTGRTYVPIEAARLRYFGGTSNHWTGQCRPLDPIDFEKRDWIPYSGWPFSREDLDPFYAQAQKVCELGRYGYRLADWSDATDRALPMDGKVIENGIYQFSPPTRFGTRYRDDLDNASDVRVILHANAVELETPPSTLEVTGVRAACLDGPRFTVSARQYVLALGGIENARLLLLSNRHAERGLGNDRDLVGRFFMEHPEFPSGTWLPSDTSRDLSFYGSKTDVDGQPILGMLRPTDAVLRRERLLNCAFRFSPRFEPSPSKQSREYLSRSVNEGDWPDDLGHHLGNILGDLDEVADAAYKTVFGTHEGPFGSQPPYREVQIDNFLEPAPNPDSRITLAAELDALGQRRARLTWRLSDQDRESAIRAQELLATELARQKMGRLRIELEHDAWPEHVHWGYHHIGTTRMHDDPSLGVVDGNARVHGISNLFIAGSSVFPTAGFTNPTLTIVALALRLADRLKRPLA